MSRVIYIEKCEDCSSFFKQAPAVPIEGGLSKCFCRKQNMKMVSPDTVDDNCPLEKGSRPEPPRGDDLVKCDNCDELVRPVVIERICPSCYSDHI